jgi:hypothetical protein
MSLIEKLGYDDCKSVLNGKRYDDVSYSVDSNQYYDYLATEHGAIDITELEDELLEYRRQHGIFEVGDKVVFSNNPCALNHSIYQVTGIENGMSRFISVAPICGINGRLIVEAAFYVDPHFTIQHATDEEITQGYRDE